MDCWIGNIGSSKLCVCFLKTTSAPIAEKQIIKIGLSLPLTGGVASVGEPEKKQQSWH